MLPFVPGLSQRPTFLPFVKWCGDRSCEGRLPLLLSLLSRQSSVGRGLSPCQGKVGENARPSPEVQPTSCSSTEPETRRPSEGQEVLHPGASWDPTANPGHTQQSLMLHTGIMVHQGGKPATLSSYH